MPSVNLRSESMPQAQGRKRSLQVLRRGARGSHAAGAAAAWDAFTLHGNVVEHGPKWMLFVVGHCQTCSVLMAVEFEKPPRLLQL